MVNCVSASTVAQHIEIPLSTNNNHPNNQKGFGCQDYFSAPRLKFQANFIPSFDGTDRLPLTPLNLQSKHPGASA
jgi:hypothetical protein